MVVMDDAPLEGGYYDSEEVPAPVPVSGNSKYNPTTCAAILDAIAQGAYRHVAAGAAGVTVQTLGRWIKDPNKRDFTRALHQAEAQARLVAETNVHRTKPIVWLRLGPGRDTGDPERPGWTSPIKRIEGRHQHAHLHADVRPRKPVNLEGLSKDELKNLEQITRKLLPEVRVIDVGSDADEG